MNAPATTMALPDLQQLQRWLQAEVDDAVGLLGPAQRPEAVGIWYPTHLQLARLSTRHALPMVVFETTFCALPRRRRDLLPLLAQANQQLERGRWYLERDPLRLTYAMELPAPNLDQARLGREWRRFHGEAVAFGIELTLRARAVTYVELLRSRARSSAS